ncbi:MAG: alpha/beta fold hydrolase [Actinomycetota bacterium]
MSLYVERDGSGPRLVLVHGFTQNRHCWGMEATDLARDHEVLRLDAPGHGRSAGVAADLLRGGELIAAAGGTATYVGYSMGARLCLHAALVAPTEVRGLVLIGGTAGIEDPTERADRREQDLRTAGEIEAQGVAAFVESWLAQPIFNHLPSEAAFAEERREATVEGLVSSITLAGTGSQAPLWDQLPNLGMPVLVIVGALDAKFTALGERMAETIGDNATFATVPEAGHAAHLERPAAFLAVLRPWLSSHGL